jgi:hypothetical protein
MDPMTVFTTGIGKPSKAFPAMLRAVVKVGLSLEVRNLFFSREELGLMERLDMLGKGEVLTGQ